MVRIFFYFVCTNLLYYPMLFSIICYKHNTINFRIVVLTRCNLLYYIVLFTNFFFQYGRHIYPNSIFYQNIFVIFGCYFAALGLRFRLQMAKLLIQHGIVSTCRIDTTMLVLSVSWHTATHGDNVSRLKDRACVCDCLVHD